MTETFHHFFLVYYFSISYYLTHNEFFHTHAYTSLSHTTTYITPMVKNTITLLPLKTFESTSKEQITSSLKYSINSLRVRYGISTSMEKREETACPPPPAQTHTLSLFLSLSLSLYHTHTHTCVHTHTKSKYERVYTRSQPSWNDVLGKTSLLCPLPKRLPKGHYCCRKICRPLAHLEPRELQRDQPTGKNKRSVKCLFFSFKNVREKFFWISKIWRVGMWQVDKIRF